MTTFTTPGAAIDWMLEKPGTRTVKPVNQVSYRMNLGNLEYASVVHNGWEVDSDPRLFFRATHFEGHEEEERSEFPDSFDATMRCAIDNFLKAQSKETTVHLVQAIIAEAKK